jgi:5-methyltetrahydrofolate--homocysteine methyltransferase
MSIQLHFTEEDRIRVEADWSAWWAGELERPLVMIEHLEAPPDRPAPQAYSYTSNYSLAVPHDIILDQYQAVLEAKRFYGDTLPKWWPNFGPGIMAGFLGTKVHCVPDTVWFEPFTELPITAIQPAYDPDNIWWLHVHELTRRAVERWEGRVAVAHTDLGGNLDIVASLRTTQQLLLDLYDAPEEVARLQAVMTRLWLRYYDELDAVIRPGCSGTTPWAAIWSPLRCYMLQSDFCYMISPKMFERFVLPDLADCCAALDHAFYHLDGKGEIPHLDMLLALERLRGIQWIPGDGAPPPHEWLPLLQRIRAGGKLCQVYVTPRGARTIVRELGGKGFALAIDADLPEADARALIAELCKHERTWR